jgi:transcription elongation GreA/GreB family factor
MTRIWLRILNIREQEINEARIAELEDKLARAEVIDVSKLSGVRQQVELRRSRGRHRWSLC